MIKRMTLVTVLFASAGLWSAPALALSFATCSVSASGVVFGAYDPLHSAPLDSSGSITFRCTSIIALLSLRIVSFEVQLSSGNSGSFIERTMSSGSSTLEYNLYTNSARNTVWGDETGGTGLLGGILQFPPLLSIGTVKEASFTAYGRIFGGQLVPAGSYSDAITVTILY